jgi:hypothetical protein
MGRPPGVKNKPKVATVEQVGGTMKSTPRMAGSTAREAIAPLKTKAKPVRVDQQVYDRRVALEEEQDALYIPPELIPDGMRYNWKTLSVLGQQQTRRFGRFEATGWSPVPAERHPGLFTPKGFKGNIEYDGLVLMEKPEELCLQSEAREYMKARAQVMGKEAQIRGGDVDGVGFDTKHRSAQRVNRVSKSYEPFKVPEE